MKKEIGFSNKYSITNATGCSARMDNNNLGDNRSYTQVREGNIRNNEAFLQNLGFTIPIAGSSSSSTQLRKRKAPVFSCIGTCIQTFDTANQLGGHQSSCAIYREKFPCRKNRAESKILQNEAVGAVAAGLTAANTAQRFRKDSRHHEVNSSQHGHVLYSNADSGTNTDSNDGDAASEDNNINIQHEIPNVRNVILNYPSKDVLNHQIKLQKTTSKETMFRVRRHRMRNSDGIFEQIVGLNSADYIDLSAIGALFQNSDSSGNFLLKTFNRILKRHGLNKHLKVPKLWKTITSGVIKIAKEENTVNLIKVPIETQIWGDIDVNNNPLRAPYGISLDYGEVIGTKILSCNAEKLRFLPVTSQNNEDIVITDFFTSKMCREVVAGVYRKFGKTTVGQNLEAGKVFKNVVIFIVMSEDEAALDAGRKKVGEPLVIEILNLNKKDSEVLLMGLAPVDPLMMSLEQAHVLLESKQNILIKDIREKVIMRRRRSVHNIYHKEVYKTLQKYDQNGCFLQCGRPKNTEIDDEPTYNANDEGRSIIRNGEIVVAFFVIVAITGDNKALDNLGSVQSHRNGRKCRRCDCRDCSGAEVGNTRDHALMKQATTEMDRIDLAEFLNSRGRK
jgi:hypothetical protein